MTEKIKLNRGNSELRQDIITKEWILVFTGGSEGLELVKNEQNNIDSKKVDAGSCKFCNPDNVSHDTLIYTDNTGGWTLRVTPNPDSILSPDIDLNPDNIGPYKRSAGKGIHEFAITKSHDQELSDLQDMAIVEVIDSLTDRYINLMNQKEVEYISIVKNYDFQSVKNISHPHINIFGLPFIPSKIFRELNGAEKYYLENQRCPYCVMLDFEVEDGKKRIITEDQDFIALCPYTARSAFEIIIMPKEHTPYFERLNEKKKINLGKMLHQILNKMNTTLNKPEYNLYIQSSPCDGRDYYYNHWSIIIIPKAPLLPKFEYGIDLDINIIQPAICAQFLRDAS